jgi:WD40 repeat protein
MFYFSIFFFCFCRGFPDGAIILWQKMDTLAQRVQSSAEMMDEEDESQWEQETWRQVRSLRYENGLFIFMLYCCIFRSLRSCADRFGIFMHVFADRRCFIFRGHPQDVYDIAWSPTSEFLLSGSIDHMAMVWDLSGAHRTRNELE